MQLGSTFAGQVVTWSDTQVTAAVAAGAVSGVARVQQGGVWSNALAFTVPGGGATVTLAPNLVNLVVGETRTIQATGANGQPLTGLAWTTSDAAMVSLSTDDPPVLTAMAAGHATVKAGTASVDVTVWAGTPPVGTVIWSNPGNGSGVYSIVPAVPSATGVADVFAFQGDGTVQAITSEGKTAWTADVSMAYPVVPDFQGGLVGIDQSGYSGAIVKWDGMTGQRGPAYTPSGTLEYELGVHTDGTVFAMQRNPNAVIGVDPAIGTQKFSIAVTVPGQSEGPYFGGMIIGGDGYAYVPYSYRGYPIDCSDGVGLCEVYHLRLLRIASGGSHDDIPIADVDTLFSELPTLGVHLITNGDTGALLSWSAWNGDGGPVVGMAVTNGTGVSRINGSMAAGQASAVEPVLQAQDGSFVGTVWAGEDGDTRYMVAFDAAGSMRWSVPNEQPLIATADGGVIAQSGITYDQNGNATGQMGILPVYSWPGNAYSAGQFLAAVAAPALLYAGWWPIEGANDSENGTADEAQRYPPLPRCSDRLPLVCPTVGDRLWNAQQDLVNQLRNDASCRKAAEDWVFSKVTTGGLWGFLEHPIDTLAFINYVAKTPRFYSGPTSSLDDKEAYCGEVFRIDCSGTRQKVRALFSGGDTTAATVTPSNPLKIFWEPSYTPPANGSSSMGVGVDPGNYGVNISNESNLFHEALHGLTGKWDPAIASLLGVAYPPSENISIYIRDHVLSTCPTFRK